MIKKIIIFILMILTFNSFSEDLVKIENANFVFTNSEDAKNILNENDDFVNNLSQFDKSARLKTSKDVSLNEYKDFISKQTLEWKDPEITKFNKAIDQLVNKMKPYNILVPKNINLIKTTGLEEGNASYCRGYSAIVFPESEVNKNGVYLDKLIIHELFHIYSKNNLEKLMNYLFLKIFINGKSLIVGLDQVKNYFQLIGENTEYIIHPEEILADNFVLLINNEKNIKTKSIIDEMKKILK